MSERARRRRSGKEIGPAGSKSDNESSACDLCGCFAPGMEFKPDMLEIRADKPAADLSRKVHAAVIRAQQAQATLWVPLSVPPEVT